MTVDVAPSLALAARASLRALESLTRAEVLRKCMELARVPWIHAGLAKAGACDMGLLGRMDVPGPEGAPWPCVGVVLRRSAPGLVTRSALLLLYLDEDGEWAVTEREDWRWDMRVFRGDDEGEPSVLNGDRPALGWPGRVQRGADGEPL